jgi:hypothetical protein
MPDTEFKLFIEAEKTAIEISKWLEGERINRDPGEEFVKHWIKQHAKKFKDDWDKSSCKFCSNTCRYKTVEYCNNFSGILTRVEKNDNKTTCCQ